MCYKPEIYERVFGRPRAPSLAKVGGQDHQGFWEGSLVPIGSWFGQVIAGGPSLQERKKLLETQM